jgi:hypothetical protein
MSVVRKALVVVGLLAVLAAAWVWWSRPVPVDMAAYVPADAVVYLEANSLPEIAEALTSSAAWRAAQAEGGGKGWGWAGRVGRFAALTGVGSARAVVLARAQVAVAVLGFKSEEEAETAVIAPRVGLVVETHTSDWRARPAVEELVADFARRNLAEPQTERKESDGVPLVAWSERGGGRRRIVAVVQDGVAFVANDEAVVRACLDVRRGARQSLAGHAQLAEMRARLDAPSALAFGFTPKGNAPKIVEALAPAYAAVATEEAREQSMMATVLPKLAEQLVMGVGWSARAAGGRIEDRYLLELPDGMAERLRAPLATAASPPHRAAGLLPHDTHQATVYHSRNPEFALRGLKAVISSNVDVTSAVLVSLVLEGAIKSFGIEEPQEFLRGVGTEVVTARLHEGDEEKVLIAEVLDRAALRAQVLKGRAARPEQLDGAELFLPSDPDGTAAAFAGEHLILGPAPLVRRCLAARRENRTLREAPAYKNLTGGEQPPLAQSLQDERAQVAALVTSLSGRAPARAPAESYSLTETRLHEVGVERRTLSAFGQFGDLVARLGR